MFYGQLMRWRNRAFDSGKFVTVHFPVPVVSIGNITVGGTGKTPILCEIVQWALTNQIKPAIISRGYRGQFSGVVRVPVDGDARFYGDEPTMMARRFPDVPVYVGADRVAVMTELLKNEKVNIVFADDAFQHRRLGRQLDVVVLDATEKLTNYAVMPLGRAREGLQGLQRAQLIILNKINLISPDQKQKLYDFLEKKLEALLPEIVEAEYYVHEIQSLKTGEQLQPKLQEKVYLISGVGNPRAVETLTKRQFDLQKHFSFADHHPYTSTEIKNIIAQAQKSAVSKVLLTEKDAVKVEQLDVDKQYLWKTVLTVKLSLRAKSLYEKIERLVR
jgi:tetraacyldisaccharide 4'-kinase